ncbi:spore coat protein U, partial [Pseudomonas aeruginosa]|nr:spore coat protein U [Pseudomonas aeruginosa]MCR7718263.1 spore coat protein U [Pseudomonas aeruginosa]
MVLGGPMSLNRYLAGGLLCLLGCNPANAQ